MNRPALVFTCEHGGNEIPQEWRKKVIIPKDVLKSHRGWDPGALDVMYELAQVSGKHVYVNKVTRLLVELNRSLGHHGLFSEYCNGLTLEERTSLLQTIYYPFRHQVEGVIKGLLRKQVVWHLSIHSFTPVLFGEVRQAEIGLLYDPRRKEEKAFALRWKTLLKAHYGSDFRIRMNYPYRGISDGFVTALRKVFPKDTYLGLEIEVNQGLLADPAGKKHVSQALKETLSALFAQGA